MSTSVISTRVSFYLYSQMPVKNGDSQHNKWFAWELMMYRCSRLGFPSTSAPGCFVVSDILSQYCWHWHWHSRMILSEKRILINSRPARVRLSFARRIFCGKIAHPNGRERSNDSALLSCALLHSLYLKYSQLEFGTYSQAERRWHANGIKVAISALFYLVQVPEQVQAIKVKQINFASL